MHVHSNPYTDYGVIESTQHVPQHFSLQETRDRYRLILSLLYWLLLQLGINHQKKYHYTLL